MRLHQEGRIPANAYVLDLDAVEENSRTFAAAAAQRNLKVFAMTQTGRAATAVFCQAVMRGGIDRSVAVDMACAIACDRAGLKTGHLGHLVQVPRHEAAAAARDLKPDYWTVFSDQKASEAAAAAEAAGREQALLARIQTEGDIFYRGHEGGFSAQEITAVRRPARCDGRRSALPASPHFRRCCSMPKAARSSRRRT